MSEREAGALLKDFLVSPCKFGLCCEGWWGTPKDLNQGSVCVCVCVIRGVVSQDQGFLFSLGLVTPPVCFSHCSYSFMVIKKKCIY